ncbi:uncharacterized protein LOC144382995 [Gasterosteus aculeatus]
MPPPRKVLKRGTGDIHRSGDNHNNNDGGYRVLLQNTEKQLKSLRALVERSRVDAAAAAAAAAAYPAEAFHDVDRIHYTEQHSSYLDSGYADLVSVLDPGFNTTGANSHVLDHADGPLVYTDNDAGAGGCVLAEICDDRLNQMGANGDVEHEQGVGGPAEGHEGWSWEQARTEGGHDDTLTGGGEIMRGGETSSGIEGRTVTMREMPSFNAFELRQGVDFRNVDLTDLEQIPYMVREIVAGVIDRAVEASPAGSVLNVLLRGPSLASDIQAVLRVNESYNSDLFMEQIAQVIQSNDETITDDELELVITVAKNRNGGGYLKLANVPYDVILSKKGRFLHTPDNTDNNLCFSLCLAHFNHPDMSLQDKVRFATQLHRSLGFGPMHKVSFSDVDAFERHLGVKIIIFHHAAAGRKRLQCFQTHDAPHPRTVWLYLHNDHYHLIENQQGFFGAKQVCQYCYQAYEHRLYHSCEQLCNVCFTLECRTQLGKTQKCGDCKRICKSKYCFDQHKRPESVHALIPCDAMKYCEACGKTYKAGQKAHKCAPKVCVHCGEQQLESNDKHECFIQPLEKKEPQTTYILFDFETRFHNGKHEANYVCAMDLEGKKFCFSTLNCVDTFVKYYRRPRYKGYTFIAHNASGFDNYILLEYFVKQKITPQVTMRGSRVILMYDRSYRQRWIDSFSFLPMRLSKTPAALGFSDVEKGYFPHKFNTREHEYYVGKYPDPSYYGFDDMSDSDKARFMEWYNTVSGGTFDFQKEIGRYCVNDVEVLRKACSIYRETFIECTELDPFSFTTLASSCMGVFKTLFLPKDTVALTFEGAYTAQNKTYSDVSMQWLEYVALTENIEIKHALNHGEQLFEPFYVDGYNSVTNTCYEFAGCFFHGCVKCHVQSDMNPVTKITYGRQYRVFMDKIYSLQKQHGLRVVVMWECEWSSLKRTSGAVQAFMVTYKKRERLEPRKALFGGRTNAMKLYHKIGADEKIRYYDFTSLYPTVQAKKQYPVGHPQVILKDFESIDKYFGLIKCTVLPPRGLFHPVLPYRCHDKLMFPLCGKCAEDLNQSGECTHGDRDRLLAGVWVSIELQKAVEKGYRLVSIDEVWHFPNKTDTLFSGYVKTFMKCKQEASGYPGHVKTPDDKEKYVKDYFEKEGIQLNPDKIRVNKAMRSCNKLLLNSLWGRFSMRNNMPACELITDPARFTQLMFSDHFDVRQFCFISDDVALVQWRHADARGSRIKDVNVFIGALTTAHARLMLYDLLDKLQERVLYCDTDSIVFTSRGSDWVPPLGAYLGDLTDELNSGDICGLPSEDYITEFVSGGPKCYAYNTIQGKTAVKCKGVTLNARNASVVTPQSLIGLVQAYVTNHNTHTLTTVSETIRRDKKKFHLKNETVFKQVRVVYNKRRVLSDYTTLPYGY